MKQGWLTAWVIVCSISLFIISGCQEQVKKESSRVVQPDSQLVSGEAMPAQEKGTSEDVVGSEKDGRPQQKRQVSSAANIDFEKTKHNFGEIPPGSKQECKFKFTNTGGQTLKIKRVTRVCGCTPYRLEKELYAPGESGVLTVGYNASSASGSVSKHLSVYSNDPDNSRVRLTINAYVRPKMSYKPKKLTLALNKDNAGCQEITLKSLDNEPFAIKQIHSTGKTITADYDSSVEKTEFVLSPKVNMKRLERVKDGTIAIYTTHPHSNRITIFFESVREFEVTPQQIVIFDANPAESTQREVWVIGNYQQDFEIDSVSCRNGFVKLVKKERLDNRYKLSLEITAPQQTDENQRVFHDSITVKLHSGRRLQIACNGFYASG